MKREFKKLLFVIREELELTTDIRDFTTLFLAILRRKSSEWFRLSIKKTQNCVYGVQWSVYLAFQDFAYM